MSSPPADPFDSIESAHEFMVLLEDSIGDALRDVREDLDSATGEDRARRAEALALAVYKMSQLESNVQKSRRILNDLRSIRRLLLAQRAAEPGAHVRTAAASAR